MPKRVALSNKSENTFLINSLLRNLVITCIKLHLFGAPTKLLTDFHLSIISAAVQYDVYSR